MSDLQKKLESALQSASGLDDFSRLVNASLAASAQQFPGLGLIAPKTRQGLNFRLADSTAPGTLISAADAGEMLQRIQRAVARLARARRLRLPDVAKLVPSDFEYARLDVAVSMPGSLMVSLTPHIDSASAGDERLRRGAITWAELGAAELIRALPENADDDQSLDSILDASPVVRRAVADLIMNRTNADLDLSFALDRSSGEEIDASLTSQQARILEDRLNVVREERELVRLGGRLDGVRTRRQIFYFEPEGQPEIHGFVDDSLVDVVKQHLGAEVELVLESFVLRSSSGKRSRRRYRLIEVAGHATQLPPDSDLDDESE